MYCVIIFSKYVYFKYSDSYSTIMKNNTYKFNFSYNLIKMSIILLINLKRDIKIV